MRIGLRNRMNLADDAVQSVVLVQCILGSSGIRMRFPDRLVSPVIGIRFSNASGNMFGRDIVPAVISIRVSVFRQKIVRETALRGCIQIPDGKGRQNADQPVQFVVDIIGVGSGVFSQIHALQDHIAGVVLELLRHMAILILDTGFIESARRIIPFVQHPGIVLEPKQFVFGVGIVQIRFRTALGTELIAGSLLRTDAVKPGYLIPSVSPGHRLPGAAAVEQRAVERIRLPAPIGPVRPGWSGSFVRQIGYRIVPAEGIIHDRLHHIVPLRGAVYVDNLFRAAQSIAIRDRGHIGDRIVLRKNRTSAPGNEFNSIVSAVVGLHRIGVPDRDLNDIGLPHRPAIRSRPLITRRTGENAGMQEQLGCAGNRLPSCSVVLIPRIGNGRSAVVRFGLRTFQHRSFSVRIDGLIPADRTGGDQQRSLADRLAIAERPGRFHSVFIDTKSDTKVSGGIYALIGRDFDNKPISFHFSAHPILLDRAGTRTCDRTQTRKGVVLFRNILNHDRVRRYRTEGNSHLNSDKPSVCLHFIDRLAGRNIINHPIRLRQTKRSANKMDQNKQYETINYFFMADAI